MTRTAVLAVTRAADDPTTAQSTLISQLSWSKSRLIYELQHGLPYRTFPPGIVVDWSIRSCRRISTWRPARWRPARYRAFWE